jgi:hypothetical protein
MLKNVTLSAEAKLIEAARKRASEQNTTLNKRMCPKRFERK